MHTVSNLEAAVSYVFESPEFARKIVGDAFQDFITARQSEVARRSKTVVEQSKVICQSESIGQSEAAQHEAANNNTRTFYTKERAVLIPSELDSLIQLFGNRIRQHFKLDNHDMNGETESVDYTQNIIDSVRKVVFALPTLSNIRIALDDALTEEPDVRQRLVGFFTQYINGEKWQDILPKERFTKILQALEKRLFQIFLERGKIEAKKHLCDTHTVHYRTIGYGDIPSLTKRNREIRRDFARDFALRETNRVMSSIMSRFELYNTERH